MACGIVACYDTRMGKSGPDDRTDTSLGRDAILDELSRLDAPADQQAAPQPVHVYRPPKASHHTGMIGAIFGVFGDLFKGGAGHAAPIITRVVLLAAVLGGLGYGGLLLMRGFDKSSGIRRELDKLLAEYERPIRANANELVHQAKLNAYFNTVEFGVDPIINEMPIVVNFEVFNSDDRLNKAIGTGTHGAGSINLQSRSYTLRIVNEGNTVANERYELPPKTE